MDYKTLYDKIIELEADEPLLLYSGKDIANLASTLNVRYVYRQNASLVFDTEINGPYAANMNLTFPPLGTRSRAFAVDSRPIVGKKEYLLKGVVTEDIEYGFEQEIQKCRFFVLNLYPFMDNIGMQSDQPVSLALGNWSVVVTTLPKAEWRFRQAMNYHGYTFTHSVEMHRRDGGNFSPGDAMDLLNFLHYAFSFLQGGRCACVLPSGFTAEESLVWQRWGVKSYASPIDYSGTWFIQHQASICLTVIEAIHHQWQDRTQDVWLPYTINLYSAANRNTSGTELALSNSQSLLEILCWVALVEQSNILSADDLERMTASARIEMLIDWAGISPALPPRFTYLVDAANTLQATNGPSIATKIRNNIVHPTKKNLRKLDTIESMSYYEAWQLCMYYAELVLLRIFNYSGVYNDRLIAASSFGRVRQVPWAP